MSRRVARSALVSAFLLAACGPATQPTPKEPTKESPLVVNQDQKQVLVYAEVNRKYVTDPTRHGVVFKDGLNGSLSVFRAFSDSLPFHDALVEIGLTPGNNVKPDSPAGTIVQGDDVSVTVSWGEHTHNINDLIASTGELGGKPIAPRFGGNYEFQKNVKHTGCILCLDSCAAGITSNSSLGTKSFDTGQVEFRGVDAALPADATPVIITFKRAN